MISVDQVICWAPHARRRTISKQTYSESDFSHLRMVRGDVHLTLTYVAGSTPRPGGSAFVLLNGNTVLEINPPEGPAGVQRIETVLTLRPGTNNLRMVANVFGGEDGTSAHLFGVCMGDPLLDCHYETDEPLASIDQDWRLVSP